MKQRIKFLGRKALGGLAIMSAVSALALSLYSAAINASAQSTTEPAANPSIDPAAPARTSPAPTPSTARAPRTVPGSKSAPVDPSAVTPKATGTNTAPKTPKQPKSTGPSVPKTPKSTNSAPKKPSAPGSTGATNGPPAVILKGMRFTAYSETPLPLTPGEPGTAPAPTHTQQPQPTKQQSGAKKEKMPVSATAPVYVPPTPPRKTSPTAPPEQRD